MPTPSSPRSPVAHEKITADHQARLAMVYVRQSSPGQVRNNPESYRVQTRLIERAQELGWPPGRIRVLDRDQGESASLPSQRQDFQELMERVQSRQVGIILSTDVSRLARNGVDWSVLIHYCGLVNVVLSDESQVLDPALAHDGLLLGIQGALAVHETHAIRKRMDQGRLEKASRGELHPAVPAGYVCVDGKQLLKHPDRRVRQAIDRVFADFPSSPSAMQLVRRLRAQGHELPRVPRAGDGQAVEWTEPSYGRVLELLQNPKYAGLYVYGRHRTITDVSPNGEVSKHVRRMPRAQWAVELPDHHPAYLTIEQYERNQHKIAMNANRWAPKVKGAARAGSALLAGLIRCRRCDHPLQVSYGSSGALTYTCRGGRRQREDGERGCFHFRANELEAQVLEHLLHAVSPAGVAAAECAADRLAGQRQQRRQVLVDACDDRRYQADLARRRFDHVDPANRLVFDTLAEELEQALAGVEEVQARLAAFDRDEPPRPTPEQKQELLELGAHLERAWFHPRADGQLKKHIVRTLITHVYADVDEDRDEVVLWIQWAGGHHTDLRGPRRQRSRGSGPRRLKAVIETLRKVADDEALSRILNRAGLRTERGQTWTVGRVASFRRRERVPAFDAEAKAREGWLLQQEAAAALGVSPMSVHRLVTRGILPAEHHAGLPSVIKRSDLNHRAVKRAVATIQSHGHCPLPDDPNQLNLFPEQHT